MWNLDCEHGAAGDPPRRVRSDLQTRPTCQTCQAREICLTWQTCLTRQTYLMNSISR